MEDCINVFHLEYVAVVSQQSHSILLFLYTWSRKFTDNVLVHNFYILQQNVESYQIFNNRIINQMDSLELIGAQSIHHIDE